MDTLIKGKLYVGGMVNLAKFENQIEDVILKRGKDD
jgi:hypothetical protein